MGRSRSDRVPTGFPQRQRGTQEVGMTVTTMNPPGTFAWIELGTTDGPGAKEFYTKLFGWDVKEAPMGPDFTFATVSSALATAT